MPRILLRSLCVVVGTLAVAVHPAAWAVAAPPDGGQSSRFTLVDGDRVVLLGSTFIERQGSHGYLETALTSRFPGAKIQFRNLGWSGDNVFGEARASFGTVADGFEHLKRHVLALEPTVILLHYGSNESFAGREGLPTFLDGLKTLLAVLDETKARIVFLSPLPHEDLGRPLPDPAEHNRQLKLYTDAIAKVAAERSAPLVNLFELLGPKLSPPSSVPLTDNGIHLTAYGYWRTTGVIEQALALAPRKWLIEVDADTHNIAARGVTISQARFAADTLSFQALDEQLPPPPPPPPNGAPADSTSAVDARVVCVYGLPSGRYALRIDGAPLATATAESWARGVPLAAGPDVDQAERLRAAILAKNELYFHRWRPQNETYLFGFRKHEQGQNAVEIPQFDPLVEAKELEIHKLATPVAHRYEIIKVDGP